MIYKNNTALLEALTSPVRELSASIYWYNENGILKNILTSSDIINLSVERVGIDGKFFGFGITQKLVMKIQDKNRSFDFTKSDYVEILFGAAGTNYYFSPYLYITDVERDENTNELSITAYDKIYKKATEYTIEDLGLESYSTPDLLIAIIEKLELTLDLPMYGIDTFDSYIYTSGANFSGSETIRDVLNAIAETYQAIYYIDYNNTLCFKRLQNSDEVCHILNLEDYFTLTSKGRRTLDGVAHATELGDNLVSSLENGGVIQYVRNNPFWEVREDVATLVEDATEAIGGLYIDEFECEWRGLFNLEIGDRILIVNKDGSYIFSFILNDVIEFDGGMKQKTQWSYTEDNSESSNNPTSLGDIVKDTYAKVDKVNKQIELVATETSGNSERLAALEVSTEGITATVSDLQKSVEDANGELASIKNSVETAITPEDVQIAIKKEMDNGVDKITTATGFTFNEEGLTVSKTDSEMKTTITEDGMVVYKNDEAVLTANNVGVDAVNLHATTYLIVGNNSRFEDYGENRTGCFWIGG